MKLIIDIPEELKNKCNELEFEKAINYVRWFDGTLTDAIANGTPIPDNATNGDVIKAMFPYSKYNEYFADVEMKTVENDTRFKSVFDRDWWDEPYQKGGKE